MAKNSDTATGDFTLQQGFEYLESFVNLEKKTSPMEREYRLDRVKYLFKYFGNPDSKIKLIHIAGSKGKGSTGIFAASILKEAGFKTGIYASPHVQSYKERITLAGSFFPDKVYIDNIKKIKDFLEKEDLPFDSPPTTFELLTLLAFLIFHEEGCSWAVIETGIGGRLDATNIITPVVSVITPIELEHTDILGKTIEKIAYEKSGIIKPCIAEKSSTAENNLIPALAISAAQKEEAANVLKSKAKETGREILFLPEAIKIKNISVTQKGTSFTIELLEPVLKLANYINSISSYEYSISTPMLGAFQAENVALAALSVFYALSATKNTEEQTNLQSNKETYYFSNFLTNGIKNAKIPCRIEYFPPVIAGSNHNFRPTVILDSSHTPLSTQELAKTIPHLYNDSINRNDSIKVLIFGSVEGKDYKNILKIIIPFFDKVIISTPGNFKKSSPNEIYEYLINTEAKNSVSVYIELEPVNAFKKAVEYAGEKGLVTVSGSFYMASEIYKLLWINKDEISE